MNTYRYARAAARIPAVLNEVRRFMLFVAACTASLLTVGVQAQEPATGTIRGRVQNATSAAYMENVTINIGGTNRQVRTNAYGEYVLNDVPAGEVTLIANYVGEPTQTATVTVAPGAEATHDFVFRQSEQTRRSEDGAIIMDPFTVNAERYRNASAIATAEERLSVNIKNVVSVDQFGYIPSGNVGEFVKFLPGVQIDYGAPAGSGQGYSDNTANGVSVRGFGPEDTAILIDGLPISSTMPGDLTNQTGLDQMAINNASRVELIKVATPDMPANSVGGQINLVTRNAFEYAKPTYTTRLFFNFNSQHPDVKKTPGPTSKDTFKITPGAEFTASYPITDKLGISVTGYWAQEFSQNYRVATTWNNQHATNYRTGSFTNAAGIKSGLENPVVTRSQVTDTPIMTERRSANFKVDWKPTPNQLLRANLQYSSYEAAEAQRRLDFRPNIANGIVWDETQVVGSISNSSVLDMDIATRDRIGDTLSAQLQYQIDVAGFRIAAAGSISISESDYLDAENGHYSGIDLKLSPGRVALYDLNEGIPSRVETFARTTNAPLDYTLLHNWSFNETVAKSGESHNERTIGLYKIDVERPLDFLPFLGQNTMSLKAGFRRDEDENKKSGRGTGYREVLRPGSSYAVADVLDTNYLGQSPGFGLPAQQWASTYKLYDLNKEKDLFYVPDFDEITNTRVGNYNSYVGQQKDLKETTDAVYAMLSGNFFNNRLSLVGGMRQETKRRVGRSPFVDNKWDYLKNKDGSLYTDANNPNGVRMSQGNGTVINGVVIKAPTDRPLFANTPAGAALRQNLTTAGISFPAVPYGPPTGNGLVHDLAARMLQFQPLHKVDQRVKGDPSYSVSGVYRVTKKIDFKTAYSRSFKLPKLESGAAGGLISGTSNFTFAEYTPTEQEDQDGAKGQITVANPGLKPETSNNLDFELSYHTDVGGKFTVSYWMKDITNQVMNFTSYSGTPVFDSVLGAIGLDPSEFEDWRVVTSTNSQTQQKPSGWEFEVRHDLGFLGGWGRRVSGFVSYAMNDQADPETPAPYTITTPDGTTIEIVPTVTTITKRANRFGGAGIQYSGNRFVAQLRGTYRNENEISDGRVTAENGNFIRRFQPAETRVDVNLSYLLTKHFSLFLSGRDVFNGERDEVFKDDLGLIPDYAQIRNRKKFGISWTVGVAGNF